MMQFGCGCARRAARGTRFRATITSKNIQPAILTARACAAVPRGRSSARSAGAPTRSPRTVLPQANAYAMIRQRAAADHRNQARQPQPPCDGDYRLSQERRHARKCRGDGEPRVDAHEQLYDRRRDEVSLDEVERIVT